MVCHHYPALLAERRAEAETLAARTFELTQYLVDVLGVDDIGARLDTTVTVHDACHGLRNLGLGVGMRRLLGRAAAGNPNSVPARVARGPIVLGKRGPLRAGEAVQVVDDLPVPVEVDRLRVVGGGLDRRRDALLRVEVAGVADGEAAQERGGGRI